MPATTAIIDFASVDLKDRYGNSLDIIDKKGRKLSANKKAIRARARRRGGVTQAEFDILYKPVEEWDAEELARGRPRDKNGGFSGKSPPWITREIHEASIDQFKLLIQGKLRQTSVDALGVVANLLSNNEIDERGKPVVPPSTKLDAAKWLTEHIIGKPTQRTETDISVKLQAVLAQAIVGGSGDDIPLAGGVASANAYGAFSQPVLGLGPGPIIDASIYEDPIDDDDD